MIIKSIDKHSKKNKDNTTVNGYSIGIFKK